MSAPEQVGPTGKGTEALQSFASRLGSGDRAATAQIDAAAAEVLAAFEEAGVDALLLKGRALGALLYESDERRGYADVDLLVGPSSVEAAKDALRRLGYSYSDADRGIDDIGGVAHAQPWMRPGTGPLETEMVDLHWRMPGSRSSPVLAWEELQGRRTHIEVGGHRAATLDRCGQALHLAVHAAQHGLAVERVLDELALALARWPSEVWACAAELAERLDATQAFAAGLRLVPQGASLASELKLPPTAELDWMIRHRVARPVGALHLQALEELDGFRERLSVVRRLVLPPRSWMVEQYQWTRRGGPRVAAAYALHLARLPVWAVRAARFRRHARRAGRAR